MIKLKKVAMPELEKNIYPVEISDETINKRKENVLAKMKKDNIDALIIYADLEHGGNFEYLCGFLPRFEEALLVLHQDGRAQMVLGNENLNKASKARIKVKSIHMPHFSLPNQPMNTTKTVSETLKECGLEKYKTVGIVGWKNFTSKLDENSKLFDIPGYIVDAFKEVYSNINFINGTYIFIGEDGVRTTNNANEFAHYEFGAALAGNSILDVLNEIAVGKTEMELADKLERYGQRNSVVTIMATGERFVKANMYPTNKKISLGDPLSITIGYKGGLQSRGGFAIKSENELPEGQKDYIEKVAAPYFNAVKEWLESIHIGMEGKELYNKIEEVLPKEIYGWELNPGHLCADEEWLSSPIYPGSKEIIKSGMLFRIDIIPSVKGYCGISCESGIMLADKDLISKIKEEYPYIWDRIEKRRKYIKNILGINISEEIIPTSAATALCKPFLLNKELAFINE